MNIKADFIYHNVGQGLFYSGEISPYGMRKFIFVYDCGSEDVHLIKTGIRRFRKDTRNNMINLLIISHLHRDHVNGLEELFGRFDKVETVILPYLNPSERLIIALNAKSMPNWYYRFLSDPVEYLIEKGVNRIIWIVREKGNKSEQKQEPQHLNPKPDLEEFLNIDNLDDASPINDEFPKWKSKYNGQIYIKSHNGYISALGMWIFRFFNYGVSAKLGTEFKICTECLDLDNDEKKKDVLKDRKKLKKLKKCYEGLKKGLENDFNNTSLTLFHCPVNVNRIKSFKCYSSFLDYPYPNYYGGFYCMAKYDYFSQCCPGQFLTGDIDLNNAEFDKLVNHFTNPENISISLIPHHGSKKNWSKKILKEFPHNQIWVVSAGLRNKYGHPSYSVAQDVLNKHESLVWVNEMNYLKIVMELEI